MTAERQRVIIRTGAVFLNGDSIRYACQPRSAAKTNTEPECYEASFTQVYIYPHSRAWGWWLMPVLVALGLLPGLFARVVVARFGPPDPSAVKQGVTTTVLAA